MHSILAGIRVLDLSLFFSGPQATLFLAGMGAEVIRVDNPAQREAQAVAPPFVGPAGVSLQRRSPDDLGIQYLKRARGKKGITLDLKHPEGHRLLRGLIARCDVLVENFSAGVTARLGIDHARLRQDFPRLVYCSLTGFGSTGPDAGLKSYDPIAQAAAGLMSITGPAEGPPVKAGSALADSIAGTFATAGVLAALFHRERSGEGQLVDISMVDCLFSLLFDEPLDCYEQLGLPLRQGNRIARFSPFNTFQTRDGWIVVGVGTDRQWRSLLGAMGRDDLTDAPGWSDVSWRLANNDAVEAVVTAWCRDLACDDAIGRLRAADVVAGPIRDIAGLMAWPHLRERAMLEALVHPKLGRLDSVLAPGFPIKFSATPGGYASPAPLPGQHNRDIYGGLLGLAEADLERLARAGVI